MRAGAHAPHGDGVPPEALAAIVEGRGFVLEHRVAAPVDAVWRILTDGPGNRDWNPFVVDVNGEIAPATRVEGPVTATSSG